MFLLTNSKTPAGTPISNNKVKTCLQGPQNKSVAMRSHATSLVRYADDIYLLYECATKLKSNTKYIVKCTF